MPALPQVPVVERRLHRADGAPAAGRRQGERQGDREASQLHGQLDHVHPRRREQAAGGEVDRDEESADRTPGGRRHADDGVEDRGDGDELPGQDEDGADPQQRGDRRPHPDAESVLRKSPTVRKSCAAATPSDRRADPQRQGDRADRRRSDPPHAGEAVAVAEGGGAHGRPGADVRGEHRREDQPGSEAAAGDEEIVRSADAAADPEAEGDLRGGIGDEQRQVRHQRGGAAIGAEGRGPASDGRGVIDRSPAIVSDGPRV